MSMLPLSGEVRTVRLRRACVACGGEQGAVVRSGPRWRVNCMNCDGYQYFASREEVEGKMARAPLSNKPGHGVLFADAKASGNQPNYHGGVNIDGVEYRLTGWKKMSKAGKSYLSLAVERGVDESWRDDRQGQKEQTDDDIPF